MSRAPPYLHQKFGPGTGRPTHDPSPDRSPAPAGDGHRHARRPGPRGRGVRVVDAAHPRRRPPPPIGPPGSAPTSRADEGTPKDGGSLAFGPRGRDRQPQPGHRSLGDLGPHGGLVDLRPAGHPRRRRATSSPYLAESFEHSADYTTWTIHLRDGVTFQDGTPVDGAAVSKALNVYQQALITGAAMKHGRLHHRDRPADRHHHHLPALGRPPQRVRGPGRLHRRAGHARQPLRWREPHRQRTVHVPRVGQGRPRHGGEEPALLAGRASPTSTRSSGCRSPTATTGCPRWRTAPSTPWTR